MAKLRAFTMPKLRSNMTEGRLLDWKVNVDDSVYREQALCQVESQGQSAVVRAELDAVVGRVFGRAGETYPVGALLAIFEEGPVIESEIKAFIGTFQGFIPASGPAGAPLRAEPVAVVRPSFPSQPADLQFTVRSSARVDRLELLRSQAGRATGGAPSLSSYVVRACALALQQHPQINAQVFDGQVRQRSGSDIAIVGTHGDRIGPSILPDAGSKAVATISAELASLDVPDVSPAGADVQGAGLLIADLGGDASDPTVTPPYAAALAIGEPQGRSENSGGAVRFMTEIALSLSCNQRAVEPAAAARFLAVMTDLIEHPGRLVQHSRAAIARDEGEV